MEQGVIAYQSCFFVKIDPEEEIKKQLRDRNNQIRYWKDLYTIHGQQYAICKEWYEHQRKYFDKWLDTFIKRKKITCSTDTFKNMLLLIKKLDQNEICIRVLDLRNQTDNIEEIEEIIDLLINWGALASFQGSTREYNIDDYDRFYDMINHPEKYTV